MITVNCSPRPDSGAEADVPSKVNVNVRLMETSGYVNGLQAHLKELAVSLGLSPDDIEGNHPIPATNDGCLVELLDTVPLEIERRVDVCHQIIKLIEDGLI